MMMDEPHEMPDSIDSIVESDGLRDLPEVSNRDMAHFILDHLDYGLQLDAISDLLQRNEEADKRLAVEIQSIDRYARRTSGQRNEQAVGDYGAALQLSIYQSAAHSMAAVGMLAPLYESMFYELFQGIRVRYFGVDFVPQGHHRKLMIEPNDFWNCHNYRDDRSGEVKPDLVSGIFQLAKAVQLKPHLPTDLRKTVEALFYYRNFMFHNGFEWPRERRIEFAAHVKEWGWEQWFSSATRGHEPWIFYMTDDFISHCLGMTDNLLDGFGAYCRGLTLLNPMHIG